MRHPKPPMICCNSLILNLRYVMAQECDEVRGNSFDLIVSLARFGNDLFREVQRDEVFQRFPPRLFYVLHLLCPVS